MKPEVSAYLTEMFSSIQGEGPHVGARHLFVRFYGCHRRCLYCDTPETVTAWQPAGFRPEAVDVEMPPGTGMRKLVRNPLTPAGLMEWVRTFDEPRGIHDAVVATGGEPLLHARFLKEWFPSVRERGLKTYLETSGDLYHELEKLGRCVDVVAMDLKLPSVTGNEASWGNHRRFLQRCLDLEVEVFVKVVVGADTSDLDFEQALKVVADIDAGVPFIVQPLTPFGEARNPPSSRQLLVWHERAREVLSRVRVIPQSHKLMGAR
ncbi:MAG TPA: 7-carboxy-7-deazaguanine synthase QueE [Kiritimatiellia bacterium]|nr:7-carboxy-7-deazaguanine synthase QueE [Kiritimatiellia bacterium]